MAEDRNRSRVSPQRSYIEDYHLYTVLPGKATRKGTRSVTHLNPTAFLPSLFSMELYVVEKHRKTEDVKQVSNTHLKPVLPRYTFTWQVYRAVLPVRCNHAFPRSMTDLLTLTSALHESMHQSQHNASREPLWYDTLNRSLCGSNRFDARKKESRRQRRFCTTTPGAHSTRLLIIYPMVSISSICQTDKDLCKIS